MKGHGPRWPRLAAALALACFAAAGPSRAATQTVTLDPSRTNVTFTLGATMHTVEGTLSPPSGRVLLDRRTGEASGRIVIDARSAATGSDSRDRKMHEDVLETGRYPEISLSVRRVEGALPDAGAADLLLVGMLEIHGAAHEVTVPLHVEKNGDSLTGSATFSVPYVAWGMKDPSLLVLRVKKVVDVTVSFGGRISAPVTAASP